MIARNERQGFTLIELLVVLAIIATLIGLLLAAVQQVRAAAIRLHCLSNLRQLGLALHGYHDVHEVFPPGTLDRKASYPAMSWETHLLPYLEQSAVWEQALEAYVQDRRYWDLPPHPFGRLMPILTCPADTRAQTMGYYYGVHVAYTSYVGNEGEAQFRRNGVLYLDSRVRLLDITDGTSNTLMAGERPAPGGNLMFGWWYAGGGQGGTGSAGSILSAHERNIGIPWCPGGPYAYGPGRSDNVCDAFHYWSYHPGGAHFLLADGSVCFLPYGAGSLLPALASRNGGEAVAIPD